jgi:16S rRNA (guanine1207-N2)-methyltransferase
LRGHVGKAEPMDRDASKTLFHPFESGDLPLPSPDQRALFLGARPGLRLPEGFDAQLAAVQGFRPDLLALQREGFAVAPEPHGEGYDLALVLAGRHRGENELRLAEAITRVKTDGLVVMAGDKTEGVAALRQRLQKNENMIAAALGGRGGPNVVIEKMKGGPIELPEPERLYSPVTTKVPLSGHLSKNHGIVFWLRRTPEAGLFARQIMDWYAGWPLIDRRFATAPGMFSHDRIDPGSKLLAQALPMDLSGRVADFWAGWGHLSAEVAARCPGVRGIDLYEADHASLEAARRNLAAMSDLSIEYFWRDLLSEPVEARYDAIVMNPPFHQGRAAEPEFGQKLIAVAAKALRSRGKLYLVANKGLPYERALAAAFTEFSRIAGDNAFKVLAAAR